MKEPHCLRPYEIDLLTLPQLRLYFEDDQEDIPYDEINRRVDEWRRQQGLIP